MDFLNGLMLKAALRGLVVAGSSVVVGNGWATGDEYQQVIGAVTAIGTLAYQIYTRSANKQIKDTAKLPNVQSVIKTNGAVVK